MRVDYAKKFINSDRKHLDLSNSAKIIDNNTLRITTPHMLAAFVGYLKFQHKNIGRIYFRGEKDKYADIIPALYRGNQISNRAITNRTLAYKELLESIPKLYKAQRFKREDLNPLLQHYGIKTNWIDLVDNLHIAIWFSLYNNSNNNGYIKILCEKKGIDSLYISELRNNHSSLSLRPHCQHGLSATKTITNWHKGNIDFNDYLVATVEIPNNSLFELKGEIFTENYMFPSEKWDNTIKLLSQKKLTDKLSEIRVKYNLAEKELGVIA